MKDKSEIIEFPNRLRKATPTYDEDDLYDFEEWELPAELRDKEDFPASVEYWKRRAKQLPDDLYLQYELGDAFVLNVLEALVTDGRFDVESSDSAFLAEVCAARKDRR